ncbi:MAG: LAGLIDADG family homing endonuclease [Candidatus Thorarchaeota archaeon]|jgi:hypothetical protein
MQADLSKPIVGRETRQPSFKFPSVREKIIRICEDLECLIDNEFPRIIYHSEYLKLLASASLHLELLHTVEGKESIDPIELTRLSRNFGIPRKTAVNWLIKGRQPRIYRILEKAYSISEAQSVLDRILKRTNQIRCIEDLDDRFDTFYLTKEISELGGFQSQRESAKNFFRFLVILAEGGTVAEMARRTGIANQTIADWIKEKSIPKLVRIASDIPVERPAKGWLWIPLEVSKGRRMGKFIQVPNILEKYTDLVRVLNKLEPITMDDTDKWRNKYGIESPEVMFMYLLGIIIADGAFSKDNIAFGMRIYASKKYKWCKTLLEYVRYCLASFGLPSKPLEYIARDYDYKGRRKTVHLKFLRCLNNPLLTWINRSVLNLDLMNPKSSTGVNCRWALESPWCSRIAFLQGLSDGDGDVDMESDNLGISATNRITREYYKDLFASFNLHSIIKAGGVRVTRKKSVLKLARFPMFRYAKSRLKKSLDVAHMLEARTGGTRITGTERNFIFQKHKEGFSIQNIKFELWKRLGISRPSRTIRNTVKALQL